MKKLLFATVVGAVIAGPNVAQAQIKAEHPRFCVMSVGPTQMMFSAFQENKTDEIFCQHVPDAGRTMIILDARQPELRDLTIEVRLLRDVGQKDWRDSLDANTVAHLPPKKYLAQNGTASFTHVFDTDGDYIAVVRATSDNGAKDYVGLYRFSVGESLVWYAGFSLLALVGAVASVAVWRSWGKSRAKPVKRGDPARTSALR